MTTKYNITISFWSIFILLATVKTIRHGYVECMQTLDKNYFEPKIKGTVKTIEVPEDGDLIDCVDFYKQPALRNIKDLKMEPSSSYPSVFNKERDQLLNKANNPRQPLIQTWHKYGECPEGTVPIRRNRKNNTRITNPRPDNYEYAIGLQQGSTYQGVGAYLNVWNPIVDIREHSTTQIWIKSRLGSNMNVIEVGWMVNRQKFGDSKTRFFTYWTTDGYNRTGCYNDECESGFVVTNREVCLGCTLSPVSTYGLVDENLFITIIRNQISANWKVDVGVLEVGYFPRRIFSTLGQAADSIAVGGAIVNRKPGGHHTLTQMGSGHFAEEGARRASQVRNVLIVNQERQIVDAGLIIHASHPGCYNILPGIPGTPDGTFFYYGGPGYSEQHCP